MPHVLASRGIRACFRNCSASASRPERSRSRAPSPKAVYEGEWVENVSARSALHPTPSAPSHVLKTPAGTCLLSRLSTSRNFFCVGFVARRQSVGPLARAALVNKLTSASSCMPAFLNLTACHTRIHVCEHKVVPEATGRSQTGRCGSLRHSSCDSTTSQGQCRRQTLGCALADADNTH